MWTRRLVSHPNKSKTLLDKIMLIYILNLVLSNALNKKLWSVWGTQHYGCSQNLYTLRLGMGKWSHQDTKVGVDNNSDTKTNSEEVIFKVWSIFSWQKMKSSRGILWTWKFDERTNILNSWVTVSFLWISINYRGNAALRTWVFSTLQHGANYSKYTRHISYDTKLSPMT
jgi:hypothetical protein